jgi:transcription antitermination protein NusB
LSPALGWKGIAEPSAAFGFFAMGTRRAGRELALKLLFQVIVAGASLEEALALALDATTHKTETVAFARQLVEGTLAHLESIDQDLRKYAKQWSLERMANVDRCILQLAAFEILYGGEVPASVAVDEAVEMAKKYSTAESGRFVNGILGTLVREIPPSSPS